jgi:hypothetical protein
VDNSPHSPSREDASIEPPDVPDGWQHAESAKWENLRAAVRSHRRAVQVVLLGLVLVCVVGLLVWNAAAHYARGVEALKAHAYYRAAYEFSAARVLVFPYRDAQILEDQAQRAAAAAAADAFRRQGETRLVAQLEGVTARLRANDAGGVLTALQAIDAADLQTALAGDGTVPAIADTLAKAILAASRSALRSGAWSRAGRYAAALLVFEPSSQQAMNVVTQARTGQDLSNKLKQAKDAARHGKWQLALRTALAVLAAQKDFPGATAVVVDARKALAPKPKPKPAASTVRAPTQPTGGSVTPTAPQPPPP